jgi:hypothetical protein
MIGMNPFAGVGNNRPAAKPAGLLAPALLDPDPDTGALVPPVNMPQGMKPLPPVDGPTIPTVTGRLLEPYMEPMASPPSLVTDPMEDKSPRSLLQQTEEYQQLEPQRKKQEQAAKTDGTQPQYQPQWSGYQIQSDPLQVLDLGLRYQPSQYRR